jgi:predicted nucleic acid-binding protein
MIVVSDTSPINYLLVIEKIEILPELFGRVIIPEAVFAELKNPLAPELVRQWIAETPSWVEIHAVPNLEPISSLGAGEQEAIILAQRLGADVLLVDERKARREAVARGLTVSGTLNVLETAAQRGLIELAPVISRLLQTNFAPHQESLKRCLRAMRKSKK